MSFIGVVSMQGVIKPRQHARGIAKCGVLADVARAINPHFSSIVETVEELRASVGKRQLHV
jgi:hypothetical protein